MKKILVGGAILLVSVSAWLLLSKPDTSKQSNNQAEVIKLQDAHGLAVDRKNPSKVYIATHTGLLVLSNDNKLQRISDAKDDYMGFSAHPSDPSTFYTSGHYASGGNIGFQKSNDGGKTWQKVANGVNGPVDFHAMAVNQADPNIVYGVYRGQLQRSRDEGKTWEVVSTNVGNIITLATNSKAKDVVYASTTDGLYTSQNQGNSWSKLDSLSGAITTIVINPNNDQELVAYVQNKGLMRSANAGSTWDTLNGYTGDMVMHLSYSIQEPSTMYLINQSLEVHKIIDGGQEWTKVL